MPRSDKPLKTLAEMREVTIVNRRHISTARHHVGAAGFEQSDALERMIRIGQGQKTLTQALEAFGHALRNEHAGDTEAQKKTMAELQVVSDHQLNLAHELDELIALALHKVTFMPLEQISVAVINAGDHQVKEQIAALEALIKLAQENSSAKQKVLLQRAEDEVQTATTHLAAAASAPDTLR